MASTLDPLSLAEVPVRSAPLKLRVASAVNSLMSNLFYKKDGTINRGLMNRLDQKTASTPKPIGGVSSDDIIYDQDTKQSVRIYTPSQEQVQKSKRKLPLIIYFHGGGFVAVDAASKRFDALARSLAKACNAVVVSVNYRLAPEFRYPTAYDDCFQALRWVQSEFLSGGHLSSLADPSKCFLVGDSAGGNITHFMMVRAAQNDLSPVGIRGGILFAPFFGGAERSPYEVKVPNGLIVPLWVADWFWAAFLPVGSDRDHPACNVFGPRAEDISCLSLPPILVTIGSLDTFQDWQVRYVEKMKEMGKQVQVKYSNFCHGEYIFPEGTTAVTKDAAEFVKSLIS